MNINNKLNELIQSVSPLKVVGPTDLTINNITLDSRTVANGDMFVAVRGALVDGHTFVGKALAAGAVAVVVEEMPEAIADGVAYILVESTSRALAQLADAFYCHPSQKLTLVGVTGTNGKTTIATLIYEMAQLMGEKAGLLSTVANYVGRREIQADRTTPDALTINRLLAEMVEDGCTIAAMEVSSHAVVQNRIYGLDFDGAIFTNLTRDHLDYHKTVEAYRDAKKGFFDALKPEAWALINADDRNGLFMLQNCAARHFTYSLRSLADFTGRDIENHLDGTLIAFNGQEVFTRFIGEFNVYNLTAVFGASTLIGWNPEEIAVNMSLLRPVAGRFEIVSTEGRDDLPTVVVDYAHTPDALVNVLSTIRNINGVARILTVVGCGGNRDKGKRPIMAAEAARLSDTLIITSDNPRDEQPEDIIADMEAGLDPVQRKRAFKVVDRTEAIRLAITLAQKGDVVLIAGKGHETYQEVAGKRHHFDDREVAAQALNDK